MSMLARESAEVESDPSVEVSLFPTGKKVLLETVDHISVLLDNYTSRLRDSIKQLWVLDLSSATFLLMALSCLGIGTTVIASSMVPGVSSFVKQYGPMFSMAFVLVSMFSLLRLMSLINRMRMLNVEAKTVLRYTEKLTTRASEIFEERSPELDFARQVDLDFRITDAEATISFAHTVLNERPFILRLASLSSRNSRVKRNNL